MEFSQKLQQLRKAKGLTQEELATMLFVTRTAISKWESGRGYPNIDSLKGLAKVFSVTVDDLISSDEILTIAEENQKQTRNGFCDLIFGLIDLCFLLMFLLPLFAQKDGNFIKSVTLFSLTDIQPYLKALYFSVIICLVAVGIATLVLQNYPFIFWQKIKRNLSFILGVISTVLFMVSLQPYPALFAFFLLVIKTLTLLKSK